MPLPESRQLRIIGGIKGWDAKKMEDLNEAWAIPGFKDIVLALPDAELQRFQTYATQLFSKYRVSNASKSDTGEFLELADFFSDMNALNKIAERYFRNLFELPPEESLNDYIFWFENTQNSAFGSNSHRTLGFFEKIW